MIPRAMVPTVLVCLSSALSAQRQSIPLDADWRFIRRDVGLGAAVDSNWQAVSLPHTWNNLDGQNGTAADPGLPDGYYRGAAWYERQIQLPKETKGRRVFVRFEAVSIVSDVYLNDRHIGQHRGAFGAFCYELTSFLRTGANNVIRVRADNSRFQDVAPLSGDFTMFGGIYRPASLIVTDAVCISPLDYASSGVYLTIKQLASDSAAVEVRTLVSNGLATVAKVQVEVEIADAGGQIVTTGKTEIPVAAGQTTTVDQPVRIAHPHRWRGRKDPYLYTATVRLRRDGRVVDSVTQPLGLRTIEIAPGGVLLNGEPYSVHGVNRHQDRLNKGWALTPQDHEEDIRQILDLGCTGLRLAHYQQSGVVHDLCDRGGLLVWQEIPLVNSISGLPEFAENAKQQLTEMIKQGYNHPSLCFWGLFNELNATWAEQLGPAPDRLITELRELAHRLDASRPTVAASWMREPSSLHALPDHIAFNVYPGWYWGAPDAYETLFTDLSAMLGGRRIGISEYGAGGSILHHQEGVLAPPKNTGTRFHPEEWQAIVHERAWACAQNNPHLWGTFVWAMFDFASDKRDEGDAPGRNDKGLVTADRQVRKDAFYFYQANWTAEPMVYIASRRMTTRQASTTELKVYSNCADVELMVNGTSLGMVRPDRVKICRWPKIVLAPGVNRIEAVGRRDGKEVRDQCAWILEAAPVSTESRPAKLDESPVPAYTLPDPLECGDGTVVRDAAGWREKRRPELLELFSREVYGRTLLARPEGMHFEVVKVDRRALEGRATRKEVSIWLTPDRAGPTIRLLIYQPNAGGSGGPWPAFLGLNFYGNHTIHPDPGITLANGWMSSQAPGTVNSRATEAARGSDASKWQVEAAIARGYATATVYCGDLCPDRADGLKEGINGWLTKTGTSDRAPDAWGAIGVWAWGLSRALDYLETDLEIDAGRVTVHGHSRLGKAALWAGAQDLRFAAVISNESGCGGAALSKRLHGETVARINAAFSHWFARNFRQYDDKETALPVDQHELLALIAPRPLYVTSAEEDDWADPRGEFLAVKAAEPVYRLLGGTGLGVDDVPAVNHPVGAALRYHLRTGGHGILAYDWAGYFDFADGWVRPR
jgi:beta-galactosidase